MEVLLAKGRGIEMTESILLEAMNNRQHGDAMMNLLLQFRGHAIEITGRVLERATGNQSPEVMKLLLDRDRDAEIIETVLLGAMSNRVHGNVLMNLLLKDGGRAIEITEIVLERATESQSPEVLERLLARRHGIRTAEKAPVTQTVPEHGTSSRTALG
ncbi:hypothetical protein K440DRAFT_87635 [Wilcoxina mikolae CBS 423.85]|nr:hypothetical protein K440DRAFT_87635 [Wilcoxina mikolae CBS 423.85]